MLYAYIPFVLRLTYRSRHIVTNCFVSESVSSQCKFLQHAKISSLLKTSNGRCEDSAHGIWDVGTFMGRPGDVVCPLRHEPQRLAALISSLERWVCFLQCTSIRFVSALTVATSFYLFGFLWCIHSNSEPENYQWSLISRCQVVRFTIKFWNYGVISELLVSRWTIH